MIENNFDIKKGLKLTELYIEDYKVFKDFKINFTDNDDNPLPIIILAGVNGSGKTTLLDTIINPKLFNQNNFYPFLGSTSNGVNKKFTLNVIFNTQQFNLNRELNSSKNDLNIILTDEDKLIAEIERYCSYFYIGFDNLQNLKEIIPAYIDTEIYEKKTPIDEVYQKLTGYINNVFLNMNLSIEFDSLDRHKTIILHNQQGDKFNLDGLSTGERTLFNNILYLYLSDIKNQVILIDEPELSLHPSWLNRVLKLYENFALQNNCQIIIATHSPHILGSARSEYIRLLTKEDGSIKVKQLNNGFLDRDINTIIKTIMGADYISQELKDLHDKYRELFNQNKLDTQEAKDLEKEILKYESPNSSFFQGIAFDRELLE